jgi:hypothetical protein
MLGSIGPNAACLVITTVRCIAVPKMFPVARNILAVNLSGTGQTFSVGGSKTNDTP